MHKDLSDTARASIEHGARGIVDALLQTGQSLGLSREALINAFDRAAEELDAIEVQAASDREYYDAKCKDMDA